MPIDADITEYRAAIKPLRLWHWATVQALSAYETDWTLYEYRVQTALLLEEQNNELAELQQPLA